MLDDFYFRNGSHKEPLETFEEYEKYVNEHFQKS